MTIAGANLVTLSATVVSYLGYGAADSLHPISNIKNGDINDFFQTEDGDSAGISAVQVDLGSIKTNIRSIKFWNYWQDGRSYSNVQIMISSDGIKWQRIYGAIDTLQTSSGTEIILASLNPKLPYYIMPSSYSFDIQPTDTSIHHYPDQSNIELIDGIIPIHYWVSNDNPKYWKPWVGWYLTSPTITFIFNQKFTLTTVSIHFQGDRNAIYLPASVLIAGVTFPVGDLGINGWQDFHVSWSGT